MVGLERSRHTYLSEFGLRLANVNTVRTIESDEGGGIVMRESVSIIGLRAIFASVSQALKAEPPCTNAHNDEGQ